MLSGHKNRSQNSKIKRTPHHTHIRDPGRPIHADCPFYYPYRLSVSVAHICTIMNSVHGRYRPLFILAQYTYKREKPTYMRWWLTHEYWFERENVNNNSEKFYTLNKWYTFIGFPLVFSYEWKDVGVGQWHQRRRIDGPTSFVHIWVSVTRTSYSHNPFFFSI